MKNNKSKLRILLIPAMVPEKFGGKFSGGAANVFWHIGHSLSKKADIFIYPFHNFKSSKIKNVNIIYVNKLKIFFKNFFPAISLFQKYYKKASKYKIKNKLVFMISQSIKEIHLRRIIKKIKPDIVHISGTYKRDFILNCVKKIPSILTLQGIAERDDKFHQKIFFKKKYNEDLLKDFLANKKHLITGVSKKVVKKLKEDYSIKNSNYVLTAGISRDFFCNKYKYKKNKIKHIVFVGSLSKRKNVILALKAIEKLKNIKFTIVGDGPELNTLKKYAERQNLDNVFFLGRLPQEEVIKILRQSDFLILTSFSEGLPCVFLEALATGNKVITMKNLDGVQDIYNSHYFELIDNYEVDDVVKAIKKALKKETDRDEMINYIKKTYLWEQVSEKYLEQYRKLLK